jgi:hypothetical protein
MRVAYERTILLGLALFGFVQFTLRSATVGSAVTTDAKGHNIYDFGHPKDTCKRRTLELAQHRGACSLPKTEIFAKRRANGCVDFGLGR